MYLGVPLPGLPGSLISGDKLKDGMTPLPQMNVPGMNKIDYIYEYQHLIKIAGYRDRM